MMPEWFDYDRLQALLVLVTILAVLIALIALALFRRPAAKVLTVAVFGVVAAAAVWQLHSLDEERRADCTRVEVLDARVVVPGCPDPRA